MYVLLITRLLWGVGRWARKPVNHTSWVAVVTLTDRPKSVRNYCLIELFCGVVCVVTLPLWHFCWYRGFCHRTGSDLLLFVLLSGLCSLTSVIVLQPYHSGFKNFVIRSRRFTNFFRRPDDYNNKRQEFWTSLLFFLLKFCPRIFAFFGLRHLAYARHLTIVNE